MSNQTQEAHRLLSEQQRVDCELHRRITSEKADLVDYYSDYECDGCNYHHSDHCAFADFHGLSLCGGCADKARQELYDIQRPLIEALAAEPTFECAGALGFELTRRADGRLLWVGQDDVQNGGEQSYADENEALEILVEELASYL